MLRTHLDEVVLLDSKFLRCFWIDFDPRAPHHCGKSVWHLLHPRQMRERTVQEGLGHIRLKMKWKAALIAVELRRNEFCYDMLFRNSRACGLPNLVAPPSTSLLYLIPELLRIREWMDTFRCPEWCDRCLQHLLEIPPGETFFHLTAELVSNSQERVGHRARLVQRHHHGRCETYN